MDFLFQRTPQPLACYSITDTYKGFGLSRNIGPPTLEEMESAIKLKKSNQAPRIDNIHAHQIS